MQTNLTKFKKYPTELEEQYINALDKIFSLVEDRYSFRNKNFKITPDKIITIMEDARLIVETLFEGNTEIGLYIIKNKYIPVLNLLTKVSKNVEHKAKYLEDVENAYRLAAREDLGCFLIFYEWEQKDKLYEKRYPILNSFVYYLNEMAHNPQLELIIANLPSGYGKTRTVKLYEAWRLGREQGGTYLSLCSNDQVVKGGSRSVIDILKSERFGRVFKNVNYQDDPSLFLKETDGEWKIKGCEMLASYYASTVNSNVVGLRASLSEHIDDLYARPSEALDETLNKRYFDDYMAVWKERFVKGKQPQIIITGTMWSPTDFIVRVIDMEKRESKFVKHPNFKFTYVSLDQKRVIIQVPALDPETEKSVCEEITSTEELLKKKRNMDPYLWETNFQQNPTSPEGLEFEWKNLMLYDVKPRNLYNCAYAVIDGTRKSGKDFFAMPIYQDFYDCYSLIDAIFTKKATSELIDDIIDKIITHHIVKLVIESNVDGGLRRVLEEKLKERGATFCEIFEKYNTVPKKIRITAEKGNIIKKIWFPSKAMLEPNSDLYRFMNNFTTYNSNGRNANDDAPDANAMFTAEIVTEKQEMSDIEVFKRFI